jgi:hypothetical protein
MAGVRSGAGATPTERLLAQDTDLLWEPEVMVTLAVLVPLEEYALVTELPEPERPSVPLQEYVYEPLPPDGDAVQVAEPPYAMEEGETEQEPVRVGSLTVSEFPQAMVLDWLPEVMVTLAVLVPAVEYAFDTELPVPESDSVPLHEYAYEPVPPDGEAVQVAEPPRVMEVGQTEQEPESAGVTETVALADLVPPSPVQVTEYEVVLPGATATLPLFAPPVEKFVPVQELALVLDHVSVEELPAMMDEGLALSVAVGGTAGGVKVQVVAPVLLQLYAYTWQVWVGVDQKQPLVDNQFQ